MHSDVDEFRRATMIFMEQSEPASKNSLTTSRKATAIKNRTDASGQSLNNPTRNLQPFGYTRFNESNSANARLNCACHVWVCLWPMRLSDREWACPTCSFPFWFPCSHREFPRPMACGSWNSIVHLNLVWTMNEMNLCPMNVPKFSRGNDR